MLNFLKKIFQSEERQDTRKIAEIRLQDLEEWLNERSKPLMEEVQQQSHEILMRVDEELQKSRINVELLENAKLQNPNIPFKAKQYMEGNRQAYIRSVNSFLGHMEINNKEYFYLVDFCKEFDELINNLNKSTLRSYTILQEFLANETGKIAQNIKNFDRIFTELRAALGNAKLVSIKNAIEKVQSLKSKTKQKMNLNVELKDREAILILANGEKDQIVQEIEKFSKSDEHNSFLQLVEQKKAKSSAFYEDQKTIVQSLSVLERPLRKYSHVAFEHEELVLEYLNNPIETLANDKGLSILEVLKKYFAYREEMNEIEQKIARAGVSERFREFNSRLEAINLKAEKNTEELAKLKGDSEKIAYAISNLKDEIEKDVKDILCEIVKISV